MQTSPIWLLGPAATSALVAVLVGCGGTDFRTASGHDAGADAPSSAGARGSGGTHTGGASGGADAGGASSAGGRASGGVAGALGSGGNATGRAGSSGAGGSDSGSPGSGGSTPDAGATGGVPGSGGALGTGGCSVQTTFYPDNDKDTFGRSTGSVTSCAAPTTGAWSVVGGDCNDDDGDVYPKEPTYYDAPHSTAGGTDSFDYDCSGVEEGDPSQLGQMPSCTGVLGSCSTGTGYLPVRSGTGVNPYCGSKKQGVCKATSVVTSCTVTSTDVSVAYRCK